MPLMTFRNEAARSSRMLRKVARTSSKAIPLETMANAKHPAQYSRNPVPWREPNRTVRPQINIKEATARKNIANQRRQLSEELFMV